MIAAYYLTNLQAVSDKALTWRDPLYVIGLGIAIFCGVLTIFFAVRAIDVWPKARWMCLYRGVRHLRRMRRFYRPAPIVDFVASMTLVLFFVAVAVYFLTYHQPLYHGLIVTGLICGVGCGALECLQRARRLARYAWARTLGKIALAGLIALVGALAHVIARAIAFSIHPIDPSHYSNFVLLLGLLLTPALYAYAVAILIAAWSYLELAILMALPLFNFVPRMIARLMRREHAFDELLFRLIYGQRSSRGPRRSLWRDSVAWGLRAVSMTGFVIGVLQVANRLLGGHEAFYRTQLTKALVLTDYQHGSLCGLNPADRYLRLEDHRISVAHWQGGTVTFSTTTCPTSTESP